MAPTVGTNTYLQRLVGAAALDQAIYEEVEADGRATMQAAATVVLSSIAAGIGSIGFGGDPAANLAFVTAVALLVWAAWALVIFEIGVRVMPQPQTESNVGELMLEYGGGGHEAAGTCQIANEDAVRVLGELVERINADG